MSKYQEIIFFYLHILYVQGVIKSLIEQLLKPKRSVQAGNVWYMLHYANDIKWPMKLALQYLKNKT